MITVTLESILSWAKNKFVPVNVNPIVILVEISTDQNNVFCTYSLFNYKTVTKRRLSVLYNRSQII